MFLCIVYIQGIYDKFSLFCAFLDQTGRVNINCNDRQNQGSNIKSTVRNTVGIYEYLNLYFFSKENFPLAL